MAKIIRPAALLTTLLATACGTDSVNPAELPPKELVQSGCDTDDDCPGGTCIAGIGDGLCTASCVTDAECPEGTLCTDTEASAGEGVCLLTCDTSAECTEHLGPEYNCDTESSLETGEDIRVCIDSR